MTRPSAKSLILDLASTAEGNTLPVSGLIRIAEVFGISDNNVRVALARLLAKGLLLRNERGQYGLAPGSQAVQRHVSAWADVRKRMMKWNGEWIAVHTAGMSSPRKAVRKRLRALSFLGFRELHPHLWIRPDNLRGGVPAVRERGYALGLADTTPVFRLGDLSEDDEARAFSLWDIRALRTRYRTLLAAMDRSTRELPDGTLEDGVVETFVIGGEVLRTLAFDPLLPEPIMPGTPVQDLVAAMRDYDRVGRDIWRRFLRGLNAPDLSSPMRSCVIDATAPRPRPAGDTARQMTA